MRNREIERVAVLAALMVASAGMAGAATIAITGVTNNSTCVTADSNDGNSNEDAYSTAADACTEPTGGADGNFMRLANSGTTGSTAGAGSSTSIDFTIDAGVAADAALQFGGDEFERGKIRYTVNFDVTALIVENWSIDLSQGVLGLFGHAGDGTATAVGTQDNGLADISTIDVDVDATDYSFTVSPTASAENPANNDETSNAFSGSRGDSAIVAGSGNGSFTVTIAFDIDAFSSSGCSGFICSSASGGEDAAVLLGWDNVDDSGGGTVDGIRADNYSEWGRSVGPDGYNSTWTMTVTSLCGNGVVDGGAGETCDEGANNGLSSSCCTNICQLRTSGDVCRQSAGACDSLEACDGVSPTCPVDIFEPPTVVCRAGSTGELCDVDEFCDGGSVDCPADAIEPSGTVCRTSAGTCDIAETCDGVTKFCPSDAVESSGTLCRGSAGVCDLAETCDGVSANCPVDNFANGPVCRSSAGVCDVAESCNGTGPGCPADGFDTGTQCRASTGVCDPAEVCDGGGAACPADQLDTGSVCRASAGACDIAETCDGGSANCPADVVESSGIICRVGSSGEVCDATEVCDGVSPSCPADVVQPGGTVCRAAAGVCDVAETCDGVGKLCPADSVVSAGTECRATAGVCDVAEDCDGASADCPADGFDSGTECRSSAGVCDVAESCDGGGPNCPVDGFDTGTVCRADAGQCDVEETCDGGGANCPVDGFEPDGTSCDDGVSSTIFDQCTVGVCDGTPLGGNLDAFKCYKAKDLKNPKFVKTLVNSLSDQFGSETAVVVKKPFLHCNPTDVEGAGIFNAADHLVCYKVDTQKFAVRPRVEVTNVFGTLQLEVKKSQLLCYPSAKTVLP